MSDIYIYDEHGQYRGRATTEVPGCAAAFWGMVALLVAVSVIGGVIVALADAVLNYQRLEQPYRFVGGFYYHALAVPYQAIESGLAWFFTVSWNHRLTPYPNLNGILTLGFYLLVLAVLWYSLGWVLECGLLRLRQRDPDLYFLKRKLLRGTGLVTLAFVTPCLFAILYGIVSGIGGWLFAPG